MKKFIIIFIVFSFMCVQLSGCSSLNPKFANRADMGMFSGCISGLIAGGLLINLPGAGLGCMLGTGVGFFIGEQIDKKLATRKEALMKYKLKDNEEKLLVEESLIDPQNAVVGSTIKTSVQYTIIAPDDIKEIKITETRMLFNEIIGFIKLDERQVLRTQGTYRSIFKFTVPEKISKGDSIIITVISDDKLTKTITSHLKIV